MDTEGIAAAYAAELRARRTGASMTIDELSRAMGVDAARVRSLEAGGLVMTTADLSAACRAMGVSMADFASGAEGRM